MYGKLTQVTYVNSSTPVIFTVPSINANNGLTIAVKVGNCYSESQFITLGDVEKPITTLAGNISKSGPSSGVYTYVVTSSGGIGGVFGVGTFTSTLATYTATLTDSVGCQITVTYNMDRIKKKLG
jgi:hypothetical protein